MSRVRGRLGAAATILGLTLALDVVVSLFIPASVMSNVAAARSRDGGLYDLSVSYSHDYRPNLSLRRQWGPIEYSFMTDAHGFRTGKCAGLDAAAERDRTVFVIGDSFTEGPGVPFEQTFAGLIACAYRTQGLAARNLGVSNYSSVIYHRKLLAASERLAVKPRRVVMFLDISDIHNDVFGYYEHGGRVFNYPPTLQRRAVEFLKRNLLSASVLFKMRQSLRSSRRDDAIPQLDNELSRWTLHGGDLDEWALRGLEVAAANLDKSVALCRQWRCTFVLVVYPWPDQIYAGDRDSIQVRFWRKWAASRGVGSVDAFAPFFTESRDDVLRKYYIDGDVHWTAAGHRLIFDWVWPIMEKHEREGAPQ